MVAMSFYRVKEEKEFDWEDEDEIIEVRRSNLRRTRNVHIFIGSLFGVGGTIGIQATWLWVLGVF